MYASVRRYDGVEPDSVDEVVRLVGEEGGFASIISKSPGFIAYYAVVAGDGVVASISVFEEKTGAEESNRMAADWVKEHLVSLLPNPPQVTAGEVVVYKAT
jgi:hypothetical protein